jgi:glyoxylase-like metal-dependent hydrolase (beta-lactamase superfamily II)
MKYIDIDVMCLLVKTRKHTILLDTGCGGEEPAAGKLLQNLQSAGIPCAEIDTVILSHGHADHIGGITDSKGKLAFPKARYVMSREEWEFWTEQTVLKQEDQNKKEMFLRAARRNLLPIRDRLTLVEGETEIKPGIKILSTPGHTPGTILPVITCGTERLLYIGDIIHHLLELTQPDLYQMFDITPERAMNMREHILSDVMTPEDLVFVSHFPFPGLGHIVRKNNKWLWQPMEIA